jgi:hypothetical protein
MLDWNTGAPNARCRVLKLLIDHCQPGDVLIETRTIGPNSALIGRAFRTPSGVEKIGVINRRMEPVRVKLIESPHRSAKSAEVVDQTTAGETSRIVKVIAGEFVLQGLGVAIVTEH